MDELTAKLAIWGAVTGTIGAVAGIVNLYFRYVQHKQDRANISAEAQFTYDINFEGVEPRNSVIVRSHGKTPVTIDCMYLCIKPKLPWWKQFFRRYYWSKRRWVHYSWHPHRTATLTQGTKEVFPIKKDNSISWLNVLGAYVIDQTGRQWWVKWPRPAAVEKKSEFERLVETTEFSGAERKVKLCAFRYGSDYRIHISWSKGKEWSASKTKYLWLSNRADFDRRLDEIKDDIIPKLLAFEIDEVA